MSREQRPGAGPVTQSVEREHQLAGLRAGHPRVGVDAADAEPGHHEVVPALGDQVAPGLPRGPHRRARGSTSPSRTSTCPGTGRGARAARAPAGRPRAPTRAAGRRAARRASAPPAARGGCSTTRPAAPRSLTLAGPSAVPLLRPGDPTERQLQPARRSRGLARTVGHSGADERRRRGVPASGARRRRRRRRPCWSRRWRRRRPRRRSSAARSRRTAGCGATHSQARAAASSCPADEQRHRRLDVVPHVGVAADRPGHGAVGLLDRRDRCAGPGDLAGGEQVRPASSRSAWSGLVQVDHQALADHRVERLLGPAGGARRAS